MKPDYLISIKASYRWSAADCTTTHRRLFSQRALVFGFRLTLLKLTPVRVLALKIVEPTSFIHFGCSFSYISSQQVKSTFCFALRYLN